VRPIALLSHVRKVIEKALDIILKRNTKFHPFQVGFRSKKGCRNGLLRYQSYARKYKVKAILDLKGAYGSVQRSVVMKLVDERLPPNLAAQISAFMGTDTIQTIGDDTNKKREIRRGVPEGSPLSPSLFNLVMDTLAVRIEAHGGIMIMYADDVALFAHSDQEMEQLLEIAREWGIEMQMTWAPNKSYIIGSDSDFYLGEGEYGKLVNVEAATYLGMTAEADGITTAKMEERIENAIERTEAIRKIGIARTVGWQYKTRMAKVLISSMIRYGWTSVVCTEELLYQLDTVEFKAMNVLRKVYKRDPQLRARHALNFKPAWFKRHLEASKLALEIKDRMNTATTEGIQGTEMDVLRAEWEGITRSFPDRNFAEGKAELELRKQMSEIEKLPWRKRVIPESGRRLPYLNMKSEK